MLQPIISAAPAVSHQSPSAEAPRAVVESSDDASLLVVPARPGGVLAKAYEKFQKMKAALALAPGIPKAIASNTGPAPAPTAAAVGVAPVATPATSIAGAVAPVAKVLAATPAQEECRGCGHVLIDDEKTYKCSSCLGECCSSCGDETEDGVICPKCGSVAAAAATDAAQAAPDLEAAAPSRDPAVLEKFTAAIRSKSVIIAENNQLKHDLSAHVGNLAQRAAAIATLQARITALETENGLLQADFNSIEAALKATEAKVGKVDASAARQIAAMGFEAAAVATIEGSILAKLELDLAAERDPKAIVRIARQIDALKNDADFARL
jgi:hypothetical protein